MELYYHKAPGGNFGDDLNAWLWPQLLPDLLDQDDDSLFIGIGTILNNRIPPAAQYRIFGAGAGYGEPPSVDDRWTFYCVRGPLSARRLGISSHYAITDPALLVRTLSLDSQRKRCKLAFMPHHESAKWGIQAGISIWEWSCRAAGIRYIDPTGSVATVLRAIQETELLVTEAMHGAIIADALRVPWIPVRFHDHILDFKWQDWCKSLKLDYEPVVLRVPLSSTPAAEASWSERVRRTLAPPLFAFDLKKIARHRKPMLSSERTMDRALHRLQEALATLRKDVMSTARER